MRFAAAFLALALVSACGEDTPPRRNYSYTPQPCSPEGATRCSGSTVQVCSSGAWNTQQSCPAGTVCDPVTQSQCVADPNTCLPTETGNQRCDAAGLAVQQCDGAAWTAIQNCPTNMTCVQTSGTTAECQNPPPCAHGTQRCVGNSLQTCIGSTWDAGEDCSPGTCTTLSATTAACQNLVCTDAGNSEYYVCDGSTTVACEGTEGTELYDCADLYGDGTVSGVCFDYGGDWGADCVMPAGSPCVFQTEAGDWLYFACGSGTISPSMGCDLVDGCIELGMGPCTPADPFTSYCDGNHLVYDCAALGNYDLPLLLSCGDEQFGNGSCVGTSCQHSQPGVYCDDQLVTCAEGMTCQMDGSSGTCQQP